MPKNRLKPSIVFLWVSIPPDKAWQAIGSESCMPLKDLDACEHDRGQDKLEGYLATYSPGCCVCRGLT